MRSLVAILVLALLVLGSSCATTPASTPPEPRERGGSGELQAGAAKVDITPMPGIPLGGHSIEGGIGYGVWTRLWARAIYLEDADGEPLVLVAADLWAIPAGLADAVVERVRTHHGLTHIDRTQVLLAATHTHHGPGNYSSAKLYNRAASTRVGFDPDLHEFLVRRIAAAIVSAASGRTKARVSIATQVVPAVARNRSTAPFAQNPEAELLLEHNAGLPPCPTAPADADAPAVDPCRAIDPTLTVVRLDDLAGRPLAIAAFFAVHATAMANATDAYHGDLFAVATAKAEAALGRARPDLGEPVVALFNGAEADVSPNWAVQGRASAVALGDVLGAAIIEASRTEHESTSGTEASRRGCGRQIAGAIESRFVRMPLADQAIASTPGARTAARALPGKAIFGGAEDGRTRLAARLPEGQVVERPRRSGQGNKRPAVAPGLYALIFPSSTMPGSAPLSVHRIGPLTIAGLPGEFSTIMGMRIRSGLAAQQPEGAPRPILIGLAGEYLSYFVTPQEYGLQHYEGASTLWGQYAGSLIAEGLAKLAIADRDQPASAIEDAPVRPGARRRFSLRGGRSTRALRGLDQRLATQLEIDAGLETIPRLEFETAAPSWTASIWPSVRVEVLETNGTWSPWARDGALVDERGVELLMFPTAIDRDRWSFAIWWIAEVPEDASFRLHAIGLDGREQCSQTFARGHVASAEPVPCVTHYAPPIDPRKGLGVVPSTPFASVIKR